MSSQQQWQHWSPTKKCMMPCKGPDVCGIKNSDGTPVPHGRTPQECEAIIAAQAGVSDGGMSGATSQNSTSRYDLTTVEGQQQHDQESAEVLLAANKALDKENLYRRIAKDVARDNPELIHVDARRSWDNMPTHHMVKLFREIVKNPKARKKEKLKETADSLENARTDVDKAYEHYRELESRYTGWPRFFTTKGPNGHIHSSMNCSTCNKMGTRTDFSWQPELSGLGESDAVAKLGPAMCTTCFPSAPTNWTNGKIGQSPEAMAASGICPGSGSIEYDESTLNEYELYKRGMKVTDRYVDCPECGQQFILTAKGVIRKHKIPKKKKK